MITKPTAKVHSSADQAAPAARRPYSAPKLTAFGSVSALTAGGAGSVMEGMMGTAMMRHP
jgi:hypothetical protein